MAKKTLIDPESLDMILVRFFMTENWQAWEDFAQERDSDPDEIFQNIGGKPGDTGDE